MRNGPQVDGREPRVVDEFGDDVLGRRVVAADGQGGTLAGGPVRGFGLKAGCQRVEPAHVACPGHARRVELGSRLAFAGLGPAPNGLVASTTTLPASGPTSSKRLADGAPGHGQHHHVGVLDGVCRGCGGSMLPQLRSAGRELIGVPREADHRVVPRP